MTTTNEGIAAFLEKYFYTLSEKEKIDFGSKGYNTWGLGEDKDSSDRQVNLVLKGRQRALSRLFNKREKIPTVGSYGVVLDSSNSPKCLIKYTGFDVKPFSKIESDFTNEENSQEMEDWAIEHRLLFKENNPRFDESTLVLCANFNLVFKVT